MSFGIPVFANDHEELRPQNGNVDRSRGPRFVPVYAEVVVDHDVAQSFDVGPRNLGVLDFQFSRKARDCLADYRQLMHHGTADEEVVREVFRRMARDKFGNGRGRGSNLLGSIASRLIKRPRLRNDFSSREGLSQGALRNEVHLAAQKLTEFALRREMAQQAHIRFGQELNQEIDITLRPHFSARRRSE